MSSEDLWIIIPKWDEFQHRDAGRGQRLIWLRDYARQLDQDEYRNLTFHQRGLLRDLRHSFAVTRGQLRGNSVALTRRLGQRVRIRDLEALNHAGYITLSASRPPALSQQAASLEVEVEKKRPSIRVKSKPEDRLNGQQVRAAENWIRNGLATHIPNDQLATVIADEFHIQDPELLDQLVQQATTDDIPY